MKISWKFLPVIVAALLILALAVTASANSLSHGHAIIDTWIYSDGTDIDTIAKLDVSLDLPNLGAITSVTFVYPDGLPIATQFALLDTSGFLSSSVTYNIEVGPSHSMANLADYLGFVLDVTPTVSGNNTIYTLTLTGSYTPPAGSPPNSSWSINGVPIDNDMFFSFFGSVFHWPAPYNTSLAGHGPVPQGNTWVITIPNAVTTPRPTPRPSYTQPPAATPTPTSPGTIVGTGPEGGEPTDRESSYDKGYWMYPAVFGSSTTAPPSTDSTVGSGSGSVTPPQQLGAPLFQLAGKSIFAGKTNEITKVYATTYAKASLATVHKDAAVLIWGGRIYNKSNDANWRRVILSEQRVGYIRETSFQPKSDTNPSVLLANIYSNARFFAVTKSSNIFDKIGSDRTPIGVASRGTVVAIYEESGKYSYVQCGKVKGWVQTSALATIDVSTYKLK